LIQGNGGDDLIYLTNTESVSQGYQQGMNGEAASFQAIVDGLNDPAAQASVVSFMNQLNQTIHGWGPNNAQMNLSPAQVVSQFQWIEQTEEELGGTLQEPDAEFQQWWAAKQAEAASMPLAASALQAIATSRARAQSVVVQNLMVQAGLALEQGGQAQFQAITDPTTGQPFTYTQTANGFTITSSFKSSNGKPVTLDFGAGAGQ